MSKWFKRGVLTIVEGNENFKCLMESLKILAATVRCFERGDLKDHEDDKQKVVVMACHLTREYEQYLDIKTNES